MKAAARKGFTLIEILIVVIILGILAAIVIPQFTNASNDAKLAAVQSTVSSVQSQLELYRFQTNGTPPGGADFWASMGTKAVVDGKTVGPWISAPAINPFTNTTDVAIAAVAPGAALAGTWYYDSALNKFYGNANGTWYPNN